MKSIASILVCGVLGSLVSLSAQALPLVSTPANVAGPDVTLVAGGCGLRFHRGPYGGCIRNGYYPPGYVPPPAYAAAAGLRAAARLPAAAAAARGSWAGQMPVWLRARRVWPLLSVLRINLADEVHRVAQVQPPCELIGRLSRERRRQSIWLAATNPKSGRRDCHRSD